MRGRYHPEPTVFLPRVEYWQEWRWSNIGNRGLREAFDVAGQFFESDDRRVSRLQENVAQLGTRG